IKNVVHLMLENRAFDTIYGLYPHPDMENLIGKQFCLPVDLSNPDGKKICTNDNQPLKDYNLDPGHEVERMDIQVWGNTPVNQRTSDAVPPMNGFVAEAVTGSFKGQNDAILQQMVASFRPEVIPVHAALADHFTVVDHWHASLAGPTQPNRAFVHSATSDGMFKNDAVKLALGFSQRSIYEDLNDAGVTWKNYLSESPTLAFFRNIRGDLLTKTRPVATFYDDAADGKLPQYSFIDPNYGVLGNKEKANDGHPAMGPFWNTELLVKEVYEAVRNSPQWNETLLIITYDENGGFFDHVPPPPCPNPDGVVGKVNSTFTFEFKRLGVRVPVILISPWVKKNAVLHKPKGPFPDSQFEHSSIPATLRSIFGLKSKPLTKREEWAGRFD
ncbi:phosphoesterase, partial [Gorgonomyces haynaldii]